MSKPDPRIYALVCARLKVHPGETVFLDDYDRHAAGARDAGLHAVNYRGNARPSRRSATCSPPGDRGSRAVASG